MNLSLFNHFGYTSDHTTVQELSTVSASSSTDRGDGGDDLAQLEFVQNGGLSGGVQAHHQDPHLLLPKQTFKEIPKHIPHPLGPGRRNPMNNRSQPS